MSRAESVVGRHTDERLLSGNLDQTRTKVIVIFAIIQQLIMACGFGYFSLKVFGHARVIRRSIARDPIILDEVFKTQKSCWYFAAILCAIFFVLRIIAILIAQLR